MERVSYGLIDAARLREDDLYSRPLAENLSLVTAKESLNRFMTRQSPAGLFHSAWQHVEFALNREGNLDELVKEIYFDNASELLGRIIYHKTNKTTEDLRLASLTLCSYLPCFAKRAYGEPLTKSDCNDVYTSLGSAIAYLEPRSPDDPPCWRMTETAVLALSARMGQAELLLFPTSPREEASNTPSENHDSYFMAADKKLPLQQKLIPTAKEYDAHITLLNLLPMLRRAYTKADLEMPHDPTTTLNYLLSLIVGETHDKQLAKPEKQLLDHLSRAVAWHYHQAVTNNSELAA